MSRAKEMVDKITEIYDESQRLAKELTQALSKVDKGIQDILHFLEFEKFNVVQGYNYAKKLQELQIKRRSIKDELEPLQVFLDFLSNRDIQSINAKMAARLKKMDERIYKPRIFEKGKTES